MFFRSPRWDEVTYWALDLETGGLDPRRDPILAVGMLPVRGGLIRVGEAYESLVRPPSDGAIRADSMTAHQLVPGDVRGAPGLEEVLRAVDARLASAVLLVHHAAIDVRFLRQAHRVVGRTWRAPRVVDTVELLMRVAKKARFIDPESQGREPVLNLAQARRRLGLPDHTPHDALNDAVATAELFLVLRRALGARTLRDLS